MNRLRSGCISYVFYAIISSQNEQNMERNSSNFRLEPFVVFTDKEEENGAFFKIQT